jgi:hypothetical protein
LNLDIRICLEFSALSLGFNLEIASTLMCLAMTGEGAPISVDPLSLDGRVRQPTER